MGSRGESSGSALHPRGPFLHVSLVLVLLPLLFFGSPVYAQSPCDECLKAAENELKQCLDNAIRADDKISCDERRQTGMKTCVTGECTIARREGDQHESRHEQQTLNQPGLTRDTSTKIEWLALDVRSRLPQCESAHNSCVLSVLQGDHETLLIFVEYLPTVNRDMMNRAIESTRKLILITATGYGWDKWVKIREQVEMSASKQ